MPPLSNDVFPVPGGPIDNPGLWRGTDFQGDNNWVKKWSDQNIKELKGAVETAKKAGCKPPNFNTEHFPLPTIARKLNAILAQLETGNGFQVITGIPLDEFSDEDAEILFWGLVVYLGHPMSQNAKGHVLGHVRDLGMNVNNTEVRNYQTSAELFFHNDSCDVLMLMCRRLARAGGLSRLASIPALFNKMWAENPDLTKELFKPFAFDRRGEPGRPDEGSDPYYVLPILNYHNELLTGRMVPRAYIDTAQRFDGPPKLTDRMNAALDFMERAVVHPDVSFNFEMSPGDIQLINNYCIFHARTNFEDYEDINQKRHMLRAWLSIPNSRPLPPWFKSRWGSIKSGEPRGGVYASLSNTG